MKSIFRFNNGNIIDILYIMSPSSLKNINTLTKDNRDTIAYYENLGWVVDLYRECLCKELDCEKLQEGDRVMLCRDYYIIEWAAYTVEDNVMVYWLTTVGR